jgi:hypothetical protein
VIEFYRYEQGEMRPVEVVLGKRTVDLAAGADLVLRVDFRAR